MKTLRELLTFEGTVRTMPTQIVFVALLNEGTVCWRPARAECIRDGVYRLEGPMPEDEEWEFQPNELVRCAMRRDSENEEFLAVIGRVD